MPTLVFFLARMGVVTARLLIRHSKYAVLIIFIVAAVISPGTDMMSQLIMAIPMLGLYAHQHRHCLRSLVSGPSVKMREDA